MSNKNDSTKKLSPKDFEKDSKEFIMENCQYNDHCQAAPLNDIFFEERSNPLSSRGN